MNEGVAWMAALKRFTKEEAECAEDARDGLVKSLSLGSRWSFRRNKVYSGDLSPGCLICGQGDWSCLFINGLCTARCFFCPQDREMRKERPPVAEGIVFDNPTDYVDYLEKFRFKGASFSGGEPFLVFEKVFVYLRKIRERFGKRLYVWLYTNGDLVNKEKLRRLKEAGLDEIRFNISAGNYDLRGVKDSLGIIDTVAVEIPAVPEDYERVSGRLAELAGIGIRYLNIHQLFVSDTSYKNFLDRSYTYPRCTRVSVFESEMAALKLIQEALDRKIELPVNYCSATYKARLQGKGRRKRFAPYVKEAFEEITKNFFIRSLSVQEGRGKERPLRQFIPEGISSEKRPLIIRYFEPKLKMSLGARETGREVVLNERKKVFVKKELLVERRDLSKMGLRVFRNILCKRMSHEEIFRSYFEAPSGGKKSSPKSIKEELEFLLFLNTLEHMEEGLSKID